MATFSELYDRLFNGAPMHPFDASAPVEAPRLQFDMPGLPKDIFQVQGRALNMFADARPSFGTAASQQQQQESDRYGSFGLNAAAPTSFGTAASDKGNGRGTFGVTQTPQSGIGAQAAGVARAANSVNRGGPLAGIDPSNPTTFYQTAMPYAQQAAAEFGLPPEILLGIAANETGHGNPRYTLGNNYFGIKATGNEPNTGQVGTWEVENGQRVNTTSAFRAYNSPLESFQDFGRFLHENPRYAGALETWRQTRDPAQFIRGVQQAGYATDPNWANQVLSIAQRAQAATAQMQAASPTIQAAASGTSGVSQYELGLAKDVADAFCGPAAAIAFANAVGRQPTAIEAMNLAKEVGWTVGTGPNDGGMAGPQSQVALLQRMGVPARMEAPNFQRIAQEVQAGRPVIIDTPGHYYQITGYNPDTQGFTFGDAVGRRVGAAGLPLNRLSQLGYGEARTAIFLGQ